MKYIILLGDGMADHPISELGGKTPLQAARTKNMDFIAENGVTGYAKTVPEAYPPGSDVANLSVLGYDPDEFYTGRAPLEAADIGVELGENDVAFRCNFVTLDGLGGETVMADFCAGHIGTDEASVLIEELNNNLGSDDISFYPGVGYRHLMVWRNGLFHMSCTPPHDITGKLVTAYLPNGEGSDFINNLMIKSRELLKNHEVNIKRLKNGQKQANSIWLWGHGKACYLPEFKSKFGKSGAVISAVNLLKGIGKLAGLEIIDVPGITGYLDTNYKGKVEYALEALKDHDFVYLHVEAPDEAGHSGSLDDKLKALEDFDEKIVGEILEGIKSFSEYRVMIVCDHPTPVKLKTHTAETVPFAIYPVANSDSVKKYDEGIRDSGSLRFDRGHELIEYFFTLK